LSRTRNFYLTLIFAHPLSTYAQSLDGLWHHSTYTLIASFRELISRTESSLSLTHPAGPRKTKSQNSPAQIELRKVLTRFRQALASEEGFYRGLVSRIVAFYQLQSVAREYLGSVGVGIAVGDGVEGGAPAMGAEEKREKVGLVYKGLICVGDLERYREQYSDRGRRERKGGREREGRGEERFGTAKMYYEVARGLQPDDGESSTGFLRLSLMGSRIGIQSARCDLDICER